jgi:hypothetical protein
MAMLPTIEFPAKERLALLRRLDRTHRWLTSRDQRYCTQCHTIFDGREVEIVGGTRAAGPLRLQCPAPRCTATPEAWLRAFDDKAVPDEVEDDAVVLTHHGRACTYRRHKRSTGGVAGVTPPRAYWTVLRQAGVSLLNLVPSSLQQGRSAFQQLRSRAS